MSLCVKNAYNEPYIPGSSIKGMLRTVILWNMIYDTPENSRKLQEIKKERKARGENVGRKKYQKKFRENIGYLEKNYLTKNIEEKRRKYNAWIDCRGQ